MLVFVPRYGALLGERLVALITRVDCPPSRHIRQRRIGWRRDVYLWIKHKSQTAQLMSKMCTIETAYVTAYKVKSAIKSLYKRPN